MAKPRKSRARKRDGDKRRFWEPPPIGEIEELGADYPTIRSGQFVRLNWKEADHMVACCDCGLVHRIRYTVRGPWLIFQARRAGRLRGEGR